MPTLDWIGKNAVIDHHRQVPYRLLRCDQKLSAGDADAGNLLVQGDNLLALKALLPYYAGKVKCIYIDPPYNTGNEGWIYNDNVNSPEIRKWLDQVVGKEGEDLSRHDKWLCMMYPRLALLKEFLADDGVIFVSIDDNEVHFLIMLLDEIFGAKNHVANIIWQKKYAVANDHKSIAPMHDFILVYRNTEKWQRNLIPRTNEKDRQYKFEDERGVFRVSDYTCNKNNEERPNLYYPITQPNTGEQVYPSKTRVWAYSEEENRRHVEEGFIYWGKDGKSTTPGFKRYKHLLRNQGIVPQTIWSHEYAGHTDSSRKEVRSILGESFADDFTTPKPTKLIQRILEIATDKDSLVMDSFAGSGTTAHAVLAQNAADGGNRRFILVEMEESICQNVTAQRITKAIEGYGEGKNAVPGLGGGFRYCKLDGPLFDEIGNIAEEVRFNDLAAHVFFTETGTPLPKRKNGKTPLLGVYQGRAIYLLYNGILGDKRPDGGNVLTHDVAQDLPPHPNGAGPRIVYGEACRLGPKSLQSYDITFRQIPFELKVD